MKLNYKDKAGMLFGLSMIVLSTAGSMVFAERSEREHADRSLESRPAVHDDRSSADRVERRRDNAESDPDHSHARRRWNAAHNGEDASARRAHQQRIKNARRKWNATHNNNEDRPADSAKR